MSKFLGSPTTLGSGSGFISGSSPSPPPAPSISSISPPFGSVSGGTPITLTGSNFTGASSVSIGGANITSLSVVNSNTITGITATGSVSNADIVATNASGSGTLSAGFTYLPTSWTLGLSADLGVSTSGSVATGWADRSPAGNNFTSGTGPTYTHGSPSYLTFDGTTNLVSINTIISSISADQDAFSVYAVGKTNTLTPSLGGTESCPPILADHDPTGIAPSNYGYYNLGATLSGIFSFTNTWSSNIYDALADSTLEAGNSSADISNLQLIVNSLDSTVGGGTQTISINSGGTFSDSNTGNGAFQAIPSTQLWQIGLTDFGLLGWQGNAYAIFVFNATLSTGDDLVVRTMLKNLYSIPNW